MSVRKQSSAYLLVTCEEGKLEEIIDGVKQLKEVKEIQETIGVYDIIAKIESTTWECLDRFLLEKIRTLSTIRSVMLLHCNKELDA